MDKNPLTGADLKELMEHPDNDHKIQIVEKLSSHYMEGDFSDEEKEMTNEIFRLLMKKAEMEVRKSLSDNLISSNELPHDIVLSLARDVDEVALPILEFSEVLTDDDLVEIVKTSQQVSAQIAIANRNSVSESVSHALVETNNKEVVHHLMENDNAHIAEHSFSHALTSFSSSAEIVDSMITRGSIPNRIIAQMTEKVSEDIKKKLEAKYQHSFSDINTFFKESAEVAAHRFLGKQTVDPEIIALVDRLEAEGQLLEALDPVSGPLTQLLDGLEQLGHLTPLSALTIGHMTLFEIAVSRLTGIPFENTVRLVHDEEGGLRALYDRAQMPPKLFEATQFLVHVILLMEENAKEGRGNRASDDLYTYMKLISDMSAGKRFKNLAHFISMIKTHIDKLDGEW